MNEIEDGGSFERRIRDLGNKLDRQVVHRSDPTEFLDYGDSRSNHHRNEAGRNRATKQSAVWRIAASATPRARNDM